MERKSPVLLRKGKKRGVRYCPFSSNSTGSLAKRKLSGDISKIGCTDVVAAFPPSKVVRALTNQKIPLKPPFLANAYTQVTLGRGEVLEQENE